MKITSLNLGEKLYDLFLYEGRTIKSVNEEYNLGEGTVRGWMRKFEEELSRDRIKSEFILHSDQGTQV